MPVRPDEVAVAEKARGAKILDDQGNLVTEHPGAFTQLLQMYGFSGTYSQMYAKQPNVRACVDTVAREAAGLTLKMYEKVPRGVNLPSDRIETSDHELAQLLGNPSPGTSVFRFWYQTFADIEVFDRAVWLKVRGNGPASPPTALLRIPSLSLWPQRHPVTGEVLYWMTTGGGRVENSELVVFWGYDPDVNHGSISTMETLRRTLAEEFAAGMNREGMWKNSLRKDGIIEQDLETPKMSDAARESFLIDVADSLSGAANSGIPLMLEPGQSWKDSVWSPREMEYIQARMLSRLECAVAFHIPPAMVSANVNGQAADATTLEVFYTSSLPPRLQRIEDEIEAQLLPEFDMTAARQRVHYVEFNLDAKLRGSFEKQAQIASTAVGGPVVTVNEWRSRLNLPPVEGGDAIFVPLNSIRGGGPQASPQAPVQTPALGLGPVGTTPGGGTAPASQAAQELRDGMDAVDAKAQGAKDAKEHAAFMRENRGKFEDIHFEMFTRFFARQRNAAEGGKSIDTARWNKELADEMFGVAYQTAEFFGADAAARIKGTWDTPRTANYLRTVMTTESSGINAGTAGYLAAEDADMDIIFGEGRASQLAHTRTTFDMNWSVQEAGHQNGAG